MSSNLAAEATENRGPIIVAVTGAITVLGALVVVARTYSKIVIIKRINGDDWAIIAATIIALANLAVVILSVHYGTGRHKSSLSESDVLPSQILRYVTHINYPIMTGLIKASLCLQYLRLFRHLQNMIFGTLAFVVAMTIAVTLATIFACNPIPAVYNPTKYLGYTCINNVTFTNAAAALSVITDIWIVALPIPTVLGLKISLRQRIVLVSLFSFGIFASIAGAVRLAYLQPLWTSTDQSWDTFGVSVTSGLEVGLAIIAASVPGTKPIFDKIFPRLFPAYGSTGNKLSTRQRAYGTSTRRTSIPLHSFAGKDIEVGVKVDRRSGSVQGHGKDVGVSVKIYAGSQDRITRVYTSEGEEEEEEEESKNHGRS